jgi:hypothetical protein
LAGCYWAEQSNRQRLDAQAARGWLAEVADGDRPPHSVATNWRVAWDGMAGLAARLPRLIDLRPARPLAKPGESAA